MYQRLLDIKPLLRKKSFFLFGPRSTGKSTLIKQQLKDCQLYDLLEAKTYKKLLNNPELMEEEYTKDAITPRAPSSSAIAAS